ncbi:hypothetical protein QQ054_04745 [Oscillatoria amoena NRMC-F 0135]|nr:hypothetical protein [Oscillatoria amoena NRMC-F 0135]MDL5053488.1 hypothetical protein [Oscillatoria laete-virens NRMC-F 0139]
MTLLRQIQCLLERTYTPSGVNLEDFIVGSSRAEQLACLAGVQDIPADGRVFLRKTDDDLRLAVYFSSSTIQRLENDHPLETLGDRNIRPFITFIEEINHALHAILLFHEGQREISSESFLSNLELQGKIDTWLVLKHFVSRGSGKPVLGRRHKKWLEEWLFERETFDYPDKTLARRYREANRIGRRFVRHLEKCRGDERIRLIRELRPMPYPRKKEFILSA